MMILPRQRIASRLTPRYLWRNLKSATLLISLAVGLLGIQRGAAAYETTVMPETTSTSTPETNESKHPQVYNFPNFKYLNDSSYLKFNESSESSSSIRRLSYVINNRTVESVNEGLRYEMQSWAMHNCDEFPSKLNMSSIVHLSGRHVNPMNLSEKNYRLSFVNVLSIIPKDTECDKRSGKVSATCVIHVQCSETTLNKNYSKMNMSNVLTELSEKVLVKAISFSANKIHNFNIAVLDNFSSLEILDLSNNFLRTFNFAETKLKNLKVLHMPSNNLQVLEGKLVNLTSLFLYNNSLSDLSFLSNFEFLSVLDISHNYISVIPPETFKHLTYLSCLFLSGNKIKNVEFMAHIPKNNIYRISLSHNDIETVNVNLENSRLTILELDSNNISNFNFSGLTKYLHYLNLCHNNISRVTPLHSMRRSYISGLLMCNNSITNAGFIMDMKNLVTLSLSENNLGDIRNMFTKKKKLKYLRLANISLKSLDFVKNLPSLETLQVDNNSLMQIPKHVFEIKNLKELNISNNPLDNLYCSRSTQEYETIKKCDIPITEDRNEIILDLMMRNKTINKSIKCMLNTQHGKIFLKMCKHTRSFAEKSLQHTNYILLTGLSLLLLLLLLLNRM